MSVLDRYINPFVQFMDSGRRWRCNVCGLLNEVPGDYFCSLDSNGKRRDIADRPELCLGSVELVAPADYMVRPPQAACYVFVIDVSHRSVNLGILPTVVQTIKESIDQLPGDERTMIGFVTFDSTIHFYHLKSTLSQPQMLVVSDGCSNNSEEDPFLPLPADLLVNLKESRHLVDMLLERLPTMFTNVCCHPPLAVSVKQLCQFTPYPHLVFYFVSGLPRLYTLRCVTDRGARLGTWSDAEGCRVHDEPHRWQDDGLRLRPRHTRCWTTCEQVKIN